MIFFIPLSVNILILSFVILSKNKFIPKPAHACSPQQSSSFPSIPRKWPPASSIFEMARETRLLRASNAPKQRHKQVFGLSGLKGLTLISAAHLMRSAGTIPRITCAVPCYQRRAVIHQALLHSSQQDSGACQRSLAHAR